MNIGIDIDDTISETFETLLPYAQKYTIEALKKESKIYIKDEYGMSKKQWTFEIDIMPRF